MFEPCDQLLSALRSAGWLADDSSVDAKTRLAESSQDLLPALHDAAQHLATASSRNRKRAARLVSLLDWLVRRGSKLTRGWPGISEEAQSRWIGPRLMWWPSGIPNGRTVAWTSSRLGRKLEERPDWFGVLRTAASKLNRERDVLLTATTTTTDRFLERAATLFDLRCCRIELDEQRTPADWLLRLRRRAWREYLAANRLEHVPTTLESEAMFAEANYQPPVTLTAMMSPSLNTATVDPNLNCRPLADRALLLAADHVVALQVRPNGNLHELLRRRLANSWHEPGSVWLAWGDQLVPRDIVNELQPQGAVSWHLQPGMLSNFCEPQISATGAGGLLTEWPWADSDYLVHWTRRQTGPWPGQSESEYVDQLLMSDTANDLSAFASLARIARQRRLIASAKNIRGGSRVVSFSGLPINLLASSRVFRAHRQRFDFECFGLGLRRDWLIEQGAKPVSYGDDSLWASLSESERPFFQLQQTRGRSGAAIIDWSHEAEWRVIGDVDLSAAASCDIVLFVPSESDALSLAAISPWPVIVIR